MLSLAGLAEDPSTPIIPKRVSLSESTLEKAIGSLKTQTGFAFDLSSIDAKSLKVSAIKEQPFWSALETLTRQTKTRLVLKEFGKTISFRSVEKDKLISHVNGPFRFVGKEVRIRGDLESANSNYEIYLDLHWEPRFEVFRVGEPVITKAADNQNKTLTSPHVSTFKPVSGYLTSIRIPINGLTRKSQSLDLEGTVLVTVAEELLTFRFDQLEKSSQKTQKNVGVELKSFKKDGKFWTATLELVYPKGNAEFESFETYWLRTNELTLINPKGKRFRVERFDSVGNILNYHFEETDTTGAIPNDLQGWQIEVRTPGMIRDIPISFQLKGILLP